MTEIDTTELASLLDDVRRELAETVDDLDRSRAAHRRVESLLLAVLEHVPAPIVVLDEQLRIRASSASADSTWHASLNQPASGVDALEDGGVTTACREWFEAGHIRGDSVPDGFGAAMIEEPGTGVRYVAVWAG